MTITAKIIADSISGDDIRLTTLQLRYPRFIHSEFMTHRLFSRNASSSRAIPVERLIQDVIDDPAMPIYWGTNQKGMQAAGEVDQGIITLSKHDWLGARDNAVKVARQMAGNGLHKQIVNRVLEPFSHINVVVTATEWENFFALRLHPAAQPEIQELARTMNLAMAGSVPERGGPGDWHLPYVLESEYSSRDDGELRKLSAARCARVSYMTHDGKEPSGRDDLALAQQLQDSGHWSPFEHQATPDDNNSDFNDGWDHRDQHRNFRGWRQNRAMIGG